MAIQRAQQVSNQRVSALKVDSTMSALVVHNVDASGAYVSPGAGSTQVSIKEILTSSGASVIDSTNNSIGVTIRAGSAAGTEYTDGDVDVTVSGGALLFDNSSNTLRPVTITRGLPVNIIAGAGSGGTALADQAAFSSATTSLTPIGGVVIAGASDVPTGRAGAVRMSSARGLWVQPVDSSGGFLSDSTQRAVRVTSVDAVSTGPIVISSITGVSIVRPESGSTWAVRALQSSAADLQMTATPAAGSTWAVRPLQSSQADLRMTAYQSTAADFQVTVTPVAGSTFNVRPLQSSQADLRATVYQSTASDFNAVVRLTTSSGGGVEGSTTTPSTGGVLGLNVREVQPSGRQSTSILVRVDSAGASTTLISSVAGLKHCVFAFSVMSTVVGISSCAFLSSLGTAERWGLLLGTQSSGITGANLACTPPGFLFQTNTADPLGFSASSSGLYRVSVSWFSEA